MTNAHLKRMVREVYDASAKFLAEEGELAGPLRAQVELQSAARAVVWARHYADHRRLNAAIAQLEEIVGRPETEANI
jgi:hypothetical protein